MKSKRKVLLALTINKQYYIRGVVRYAREHDWYLVTDMMYTRANASKLRGALGNFCLVQEGLMYK